MPAANSYQLALAREYAAAYVAYMGATGAAFEGAQKKLDKAQEKLAVIAAIEFLPPEEHSAMTAEADRLLASVTGNVA